MMMLTVVSMFYTSTFVSSFNLFLGLLLFCGYVTYDTAVSLLCPFACAAVLVWRLRCSALSFRHAFRLLTDCI
jgi:hypothetical protein